MIITRHFEKTRQLYRINPIEKKIGIIDVSRRIDGNGRWTEPTIKWRTAGEQKMESTTVFVASLRKAKHLAWCLKNDITVEYMTGIVKH